MKRIHITPQWSFQDESGQQLDAHLFRLLASIHEQGKLTLAAKSAQISYRHAWNLLNKWAGFFGAELVVLQKGRGARLTPLGEKLLWAEQRVIARLQPQLENLTSELNIEIHRTLADVSQVLRIHASHGYAVALLPKFATEFQLDLQYRSALEALAALQRGTCDIAGFHLPAHVEIAALKKNYRRYIKPKVQRIIRFITRRMGLMVKSGNPMNISQLTDLVRLDVRFINRQKESGTRALFDQLLQNQKITSASISGYDDEEFTHSAVAAYVAAGMADVGFGVEAAARQFGLDFIAITEEHYLFLCHKRALEQSAVTHFLAMIQGNEFSSAVAALPGYGDECCGEVQQVEAFFG